MVEKAVFYTLENDATFNALVSGRVYPMTSPEGCAFPFCVYNRINADRVQSLQGSDGLTNYAIQVDHLADTYAEVKSMADAARQALEAMTGTINTVVVGSCLITREQDQFNDQANIYRVIQEFSVWAEE